MKIYCQGEIKDGALTHFCEREEGHKGRHYNTSTSDDGRTIKVSWGYSPAEKLSLAKNPSSNEVTKQ